jgi:hypothetical protein
MLSKIPVMKHTKWFWYVVVIASFYVISGRDAGAVVQINNLRLLPTATPTSISIQKVINPNLIKVLSTSTPAPELPTTNPTITSTVTPTITQAVDTPTESVLGEQTETIAEPTATNTPAATTSTPTANDPGNNSNLTFWFMLITVGLLAVIIVIQAWPGKGSDDGEDTSE